MLWFGMFCWGFFNILKNNSDSYINYQTRFLPSAESVTKTNILKVGEKIAIA